MLLKHIASRVAADLEVPDCLVRGNPSHDIKEAIRSLDKTVRELSDEDAEALQRIKKQRYSVNAVCYDGARQIQTRLPSGSSDRAREASEAYFEFIVAIAETIDATKAFVNPTSGSVPRWLMPLGYEHPVRPAGYNDEDEEGANGVIEDDYDFDP